MPDRATVLVTGAAGFFGQAIVRSLARDGTDVIATDRLAPGRFTVRADTPLERIAYHQRHLETETLSDLVARADGVVHAAAITPPDERGEASDHLLAVNLTPLPGLLAAIREAAPCRRLILVSSAGVYDQSADEALPEEAADGGTSLYGAAKLAAELVAARYCRVQGIDHAAVRPTSLYGPGETERPSRPRVTSLARLVRHARRSEPVRIEGSSAHCDWLSVDDAADAIVALWRAPRLDGRSFNLSSGVPRPFGEVVDAVVRIGGLELSADAGHVVDGGPDRPARIVNRALAAASGWRPRRSLEQGIAELLADAASEVAACST